MFKSKYRWKWSNKLWYWKELGVEIVGETKMKISIEEDEEPWDEIDDDVNEEVEKEIDASVDENYIK